jgi:pyridoxal phosphate enzyme (YggS family)
MPDPPQETRPSHLTRPIDERVRQIQARIGEACARAGRDPGSVTLVGASKEQPVARLRQAYDAGLRIFGENRVQEAQRKAGELPGDVEWHLLGPLQTNKAKAAVELFRVCHAVDRAKAADALARAAAAGGAEIAAFLEVNLGSEASKHGFAPAGLAAEARPLASLPGLRVVGLMAIPPLAESAEGMRPWFRRLRELRDELAAAPEWAGWPGFLSMGMSDDFEVAIEEGATHVRIGTALFGPRS